MAIKVICTNYEQNSVSYDNNTGDCTINAIFKVIETDNWDRWDAQALVTFQMGMPVGQINTETKNRIIQYVYDTFQQDITASDIRLMWN